MKAPQTAILALVIIISTLPGRSAVVLEAAWVEISSLASAASNTNDTTARAGLGVAIQRFVSASAPSASATASTNASASFNGASAFTVNLGLGLFTSDGSSVALGDTDFFIDFRIEGQNEPSPVWNLSSNSFSSTTGQYGGTQHQPVFGIRPNRPIGPPIGGVLAPGPYRASVTLGIFDNRSFDDGTTTWEATGSVVFGSPASIAPGFNQENPILPTPGNPTPGFPFINVPSGRWFDPPATDGFEFKTADGSKFTDILSLPSGFDSDFTVVVDGQVIGTFGGGSSVNFEALTGGDVGEFQILGISPSVDSQDPLAFPIQLAFTTPTASFTMNAVPEPSSFSLLIVSLGVLSFRRFRNG